MVMGWGSQLFPSCDSETRSLGLWPDPGINSNIMTAFVSFCPAFVFIVLGWESKPFQSYDPRVKSARVGQTLGSILIA